MGSCLFYRYNQISPSDIDECTDGTDNCTGECVNTEGSYLCTCSAGYELRDDNNTCVGELTLDILYDRQNIIKYSIHNNNIQGHCYCWIN